MTRLEINSLRIFGDNKLLKDITNHVFDFNVLTTKTIEQLWKDRLFDAPVDCNIPRNASDQTQKNDYNRWFSIEGHRLNLGNEETIFHGFLIRNGKLRCWVAEGSKNVIEIYSVNQVVATMSSSILFTLDKMDSGTDQSQKPKKTLRPAPMTWRIRPRKLSDRSPVPAMVTRGNSTR